MNFFATLGRYMLLMRKVFARPEKPGVYFRRVLAEMWALGFTSIGIVSIVSLFMGAVVVLQLAINLDSPFMPKDMLGFATREIMILEFSSAVIALILAGKVGSNIASEIGTMRITEQIDAMEMMGINSAAYLIQPKLIATAIFFPLLSALSIAVGLLGGYLVSLIWQVIPPESFLQGIQFNFRTYKIIYALIKTVVFAYIITSVSGFYGYYAKGNSLEVGRASTKSVVVSCVLILMFDLILTQLLL